MHVKAGDHRWHKGFPLNPRKVEREPGSVAKKMEEAKLCAAVALAERMDDVELGKKVRREGDELLLIRTPACGRSVQTIEQLRQLLIDVGRQAEEIATFGGLHRPRLSSPIIHVLEEMPVDCAVVWDVEFALGERLSRSQRGHLEFERL